jgi:hypothetical protein
MGRWTGDQHKGKFPESWLSRDLTEIPNRGVNRKHKKIPKKQVPLMKPSKNFALAMQPVQQLFIYKAFIIS